MPDRDLIAELIADGRAKLAAAVPGPFQIASREGIFTDLHSLHRLLPGKDGYREVIARGMRIPDAELFVYMANRFGLLLDQLEQANARIAGLDQRCGNLSAMFSGAEHRITELESGNELIGIALREYNQIALEATGTVPDPERGDGTDAGYVDWQGVWEQVAELGELRKRVAKLREVAETWAAQELVDEEWIEQQIADGRATLALLDTPAEPVQPLFDNGEPAGRDVDGDIRARNGQGALIARKSHTRADVQRWRDMATKPRFIALYDAALALLDTEESGNA
ncbi:hypothetical protein ACQP1O_42940 (plasmid) [Nocardia sp. CA-151230]|uniref:hypothetical protein n=1 Tax=Nocardia sp. CA-151230 TaxID=3239982 RepID=UPI003D8F9193